MSGIDRRTVLGAAAATGLLASSGPMALATADDPVAPFRTPHKFGKLVLAASGVAGSFDEKSVDCPFVFSANGRFYLTYVGFDGIGYQTGIAESRDLTTWTNRRLILQRDPASPVTRYNIAMASILRENALQSPARLIKVGGRYLGAWHAYPSAGYEEGPAVIGLAWSDDLLHWERGDPILLPQDGAEWERGGLYKPYLIRVGDTYHLYYNAKTSGTPWQEQTGLATSTDLRRWTRHPASPLLRNGPAGSWDDRFASDPVVVEHRGRWGMFYFGLSTDKRARDLLALGTSPTEFAKAPEILVDAGAPGSVDDTYAHKPSVLFHQGDLYHFYCAVSGKWPNDVRGLAVARSRAW
ncbi:glycoside hydrolase family protein [Sphingomonas hengshuiensis]|uniref:beta-galactosidase n=1 Tax=Sphingomonas hengshuiensis TaxID=1609977 RepID=UPI000696692C|nr:beta-galactosidase [Sphingomonas hengshuiensis]